MPPRIPKEPTDNPAEGATSGRVLQKFTYNDVEYRPNDLFKGSESDVAGHHAAGNIDAHPDAVPLAKPRPKAKADEAIED
jgi:hypothetical protein